MFGSDDDYNGGTGKRDKIVNHIQAGDFSAQVGGEAGICTKGVGAPSASFFFQRRARGNTRINLIQPAYLRIGAH